MRQSEVMPTLRKHPQSSLWNYEVSKWSPAQIKEFLFLRDGVREIVPKQKKKVVRISDKKPYDSIVECAEDNKCHPLTVSRRKDLYEIS